MQQQQPNANTNSLTQNSVQDNRNVLAGLERAYSSHNSPEQLNEQATDWRNTSELREENQLYAKVNAQYFQSLGFPYPHEPNAPRYDMNMLPNFPQSVDGQLSRHKALGQVDRLPPIRPQGSVQTDEDVQRAPKSYLEAEHEDQCDVMMGFANNLFESPDQDEVGDRFDDLTRGLRIIQALRNELTTTKCGHMRADDGDSFGKKLIFQIQHHQNAVDTSTRQHLSDDEGRSILENLTGSLMQIDPLLKSCVQNALKVVKAVGNVDRIFQDEYKLSDFPGQSVPKLLVPQQFHELRQFQPDFYCNGVKQHSTVVGDQKSLWCKSTINGDTEDRPSSTVSMLNGLISGVSSRRTHHLQNLTSLGGFVTSWILQQPHMVDKLPWLQKVTQAHCGLNLISLLDVDLAGSHQIDRDNSRNDFTRKIKKPGGFLRVFPLLILNYNDSAVIKADEARNRPKVNRRKKATDPNDTLTENSNHPEASVQGSETGASNTVAAAPKGHMHKYFTECFKQMIQVMETKAEAEEERQPLLSKTIKDQLYAVQEVWQSKEGEIIFVDSLAKRAQRSKGTSIIYNDQTVAHKTIVRNGTPDAFASPQTLDIDFFDDGTETINADGVNNKIWSQQGPQNKYVGKVVPDNDQSAQWRDFLNSFDESIETQPWLRLARKLSKHPVYKNDLMRIPTDFKLIRIQCFTVVAEPSINEGDAVARQCLLSLGNSEAVRHLQIFKSDRTVKRAQEIIKHVSVSRRARTELLKLNGNGEHMQDLNKHYYEKITPAARGQPGSPVQNPEVGRRSHRRTTPSRQDVVSQPIRQSTSIEDVSRQSHNLLKDRPMVEKTLLTDLMRRHNLLEANVLPHIQQDFMKAMSECMKGDVQRLPYFLFRPPAALNADVLEEKKNYSELWSVKPWPLVADPDQFQFLVELLQLEHSDSVWATNEIQEYLLHNDTPSQKVLLKGLCRALVLYLRMHDQKLEEKHLRTHVMVANLIKNFALGVLGFRLSFDVNKALTINEKGIERFVKGIFADKSPQTKFTKDQLDQFRRHYRDEIRTKTAESVREVEMKRHQSKVDHQRAINQVLYCGPPQQNANDNTLQSLSPLGNQPSFANQQENVAQQNDLSSRTSEFNLPANPFEEPSLNTSRMIISQSQQRSNTLGTTLNSLYRPPTQDTDAILANQLQTLFANPVQEQVRQENEPRLMQPTSVTNSALGLTNEDQDHSQAPLTTSGASVQQLQAGLSIQGSAGVTPSVSANNSNVSKQNRSSLTPSTQERKPALMTNARQSGLHSSATRPTRTSTRTLEREPERTLDKRKRPVSKEEEKKQEVKTPPKKRDDKKEQKKK